MTTQRCICKLRQGKFILLTIALVLVFSAKGLADDAATDAPKVFSGPQVGEVLPPLTMRRVVGPEFDEQADFVATADGKPMLIVFVHQRTRPAFGLANLLMRFAATREEAGLQRALVFLSDDLTATEAWIKRIPQYFEKGTPVGISTEGAEGPGSYGLNRNVTLTVLVGKEGKATGNFALVQPSIQADGPKILQAIVDVTGGGEAPDITKFLPRGMSDRMTTARDADPKLRELMRAVIQKNATDDEVAKAAEAVEKYIATKKRARRELGEITKRVVDSDRFSTYGNATSRKQLKAWAKKYGPADESKANDKTRGSESDEPASRDES